VKVRVDLTRCDGYANCLIEAEQVFGIDDATGQAVLLMPDVPAELADQVLRAQASCPAQAIVAED
jgi:ferredoxin